MKTSLRLIALLFVIVMAFLAGRAWRRQPVEAPAQAPAAVPASGDANASVPPGGMPPMAEEAPSPGVAWTTPRRWTAQPARPMRVATYAIPAARGDAADGECAVFYFGPGQGGGVEENIARWVGQFEHAGTPQRSVRDVGGMKVSHVSVSGDYLAPSGPMMKSQGTRRGYTLLGAIVEAPNGAVFFKLTGPARTVHAAAKEFEAMVGSLRKT